MRVVEYFFVASQSERYCAHCTGEDAAGRRAQMWYAEAVAVGGAAGGRQIIGLADLVGDARAVAVFLGDLVHEPHGSVVELPTEHCAPGIHVAAVDV